MRRCSVRRERRGGRACGPGKEGVCLLRSRCRLVVLVKGAEIGLGGQTYATWDDGEAGCVCHCGSNWGWSMSRKRRVEDSWAKFASETWIGKAN